MASIVKVPFPGETKVPERLRTAKIDAAPPPAADDVELAAAPPPPPPPPPT
ncbi:MAG: hypothetical protein H6797_00835 [Candidatus Nomurabacteria bacterium]|nr:MAG: hypothetical protein H6797_00835 [Candidatus Nomurabacteria bacterium]